MTASLPHEFLPYGASELKRWRRPYLIAALVLSSALVSLLFVLAAWVSGWLPRTQSVDVAIAPQSFVVRYPREPIRPWAPEIPTVRIRAKTTSAIPVPRPDADAPDGPIFTTEAPTPGERGKGAPSLPTSAIRQTNGDEPVNEVGQVALVDQLPQPIHRVTPSYSDIARETGIEGIVLVYLLVGRDGLVRDLRVDEKKHVPVLDTAAIEAARQWRFEPAVSGGHPVAVWVSLSFRFSLHEEGARWR